MHPLSHAIDQNITTRWSNLGLGSWIQIDLGQEKTVCSVGINWHRGNERINSFVISISKDGKNFTNVYSGKSDGTSLTEQNYNFQSNTGRFIRVLVNGNTQNNWVSISELKVYGFNTLSESCVKSQNLQVTAPSSQLGFPSSNVLDNNPSTIWSNYGVGSSIQLDLGTSKNICSVDIAWYRGNERQNNFIISTSNDGINFSNVLSSNSGGSTLNLENYNITDTNARYIRVTVNGNTQNNYASIVEIRVQVSPSDQSDYDNDDKEMVDQAKALAFIKSMYDPSVGMLREAPGFDRYWLWSDQLLGVLILKAVDTDLAAKIETKMLSYKIPMKNLWATLDPKYRENFSAGGTKEIKVSGTSNIWYSDYNGSNIPCTSHADVAFLTAIHLHYSGDKSGALSCYNAGKSMWDGRGMKDRGQITGDYAVYKVALGLFSSKDSQCTSNWNSRQLFR